MTDEARTEAEAIAAMGAEPESFGVTAGEAEQVILPPGWSRQLVDHEVFAPTPRRTHGQVVVRDSDGFVQAVNQRKTGAIALYADEGDQGSYDPQRLPVLVAVLNDDHGDAPGWRDHRVVLGLRRRPEWIHWRTADGRLLEQKAFATHIEDGLREIVAPSPADMLDMAQHFQATTDAKFKGGQRLATGERQFMYDETVVASAGHEGQITIPDEFLLEVAPFYGADARQVRASFRFQLRQAELQLGYKLDRPDETEREAFAELCERVASSLAVPLIAGVAPSPRNALPAF